MAGKLVGGLLAVKIDGVVITAVGNFTWGLGQPVRTTQNNATGGADYSEAAGIAFIEGEVRIDGDTDVKALVTAKDKTVTLEMANGQTLVLSNAWYVGEGVGNTEAGNFPVRFESGQEGEFV